MSKYIQPNKSVCVRLDKETLDIVSKVAIERRWSLASTIVWCVEQHLKIEPTGTINRR